MRKYIVLFGLFAILFVLPLQVFIIGDFAGIGIQGAVYRYQITNYGINFFPITREISFVINGTLWGRTALSVILWATGTLLLTCTTIFSFLHVKDTSIKYYYQIMYGLVATCGLYLGSCVAQYGFLFHGPAGISFPIGVLVILIWIAGFYYHRTFEIEGQIK